MSVERRLGKDSGRESGSIALRALVLHCDLRACQLVVDDDLEVRLIDFRRSGYCRQERYGYRTSGLQNTRASRLLHESIREDGNFHTSIFVLSIHDRASPVRASFRSGSRRLRHRYQTILHLGDFSNRREHRGRRDRSEVLAFGVQVRGRGGPRFGESAGLPTKWSRGGLSYLVGSSGFDDCAWCRCMPLSLRAKGKSFPRRVASIGEAGMHDSASV